MVEFQPSGFGRGSYLNVVGHLLWSPHDFESFDLMLMPDKPWIDYEDEVSFRPLAEGLALRAAEEWRSLAAQVREPRDIKRLKEPQGWGALHWAIVEALDGQTEQARTRALQLAAEYAAWREHMAALVRSYAEQMRDMVAFSAFIEGRIARKRAILRLPVLDHGLPSRHPSGLTRGSDDPTP